jgi:hypothetical protein
MDVSGAKHTREEVYAHHPNLFPIYRRDPTICDVSKPLLFY